MNKAKVLIHVVGGVTYWASEENKRCQGYLFCEVPKEG